MKNFQLVLAGILTLTSIFCYSQTTTTINLHDAFNNKGLKVVNRGLTLINEEGHQGIRLSKAFGEGVVWLKDIDFSNGTIDFDVRGEDIEQHSFVGLAFHGQNDSIFDAIYLRPFRFNSKDTILEKRMIQYVSLPFYTWRKLRAEFPGKFENVIKPAPDPNSWVKVRIVVKDAMISTYINGSKTPSLVVEKVTAAHNGSIGFYVADTSGGDFANIVVSREPSSVSTKQ